MVKKAFFLRIGDTAAVWGLYANGMIGTLGEIAAVCVLRGLGVEVRR